MIVSRCGVEPVLVVEGGAEVGVVTVVIVVVSAEAIEVTGAMVQDVVAGVVAPGHGERGPTMGATAETFGPGTASMKGPEPSAKKGKVLKSAVLQSSLLDIRWVGDIPKGNI